MVTKTDCLISLPITQINHIHLVLVSWLDALSDLPLCSVCLVQLLFHITDIRRYCS